MRKQTRFVLLLFIVLFLLFAVGCKDKDADDLLDIEGSGKGSTAIPVKAVNAFKGEISSYIETTTTLEAEKEVEILSRTTGLVTRLLVEEGAVVKRGQLLLQIDDREAKALYNSSLATFEERERQWERAQETYEKKIVSKEAYEQARYNYAKAKADLDSSKLRLAYTQITAPFDGIITERLIHPGSMLSVNQRLFKIVDINPLLARIFLPERELSKVQEGQIAELKLEAYQSRKFDAKIKMINPVVDPQSGTFKVTLEIDTADSLLRPGMFASVYLVTETHKDTLLVPKQALLLEAEKDTIFVIDGKFAYSTEVTIGFRDDKYIEIIKGDVEDNALIVVVGQDGINSGDEVKPFDMEGKEIEVEVDEEEFDLEDFE